jgi:two-component system, LuxR family, response regulator FixJ
MPAERTIHVVDDDAAVQLSLERLLGSMGFATVSYTTPDVFLLEVPHLSGGCVLLDVKTPGISGLEVQARLRAIGFVLPIIVLTGQGDIQTAVLAMKAGAFDFLEKPYEDEVLLAAIEAALAASPDDHIHQTTDSAQRIARLSPREREVLDGLVAGASNKVIAFDLGLSVRTVEVHRGRMMERLGTRQLAEAIRLAVLATLRWLLVASPMIESRRLTPPGPSPSPRRGLHVRRTPTRDDPRSTPIEARRV